MIMKKRWIIFMLILPLMLLGCESRDNSDAIKKEYMVKLNTELEQGTLKSYIEGEIKLVQAESHKVESMDFYEFIFETNLNQKFSNLTEEEKYKVFKELDTPSLETFCGENSHCSIDIFTFIENEDTFVVHPTFGFKVTKNNEKLDPYAPTEEEKKIGEIYSSLEWIAESLYLLGSNGYAPSYTINNKHKPDVTYSLEGVRESSSKIISLLEEIGDESLIQSARQLQEKINLLDPLKGYEYNEQIVKSFIPDMEAIMSVYFPSSLGRPDNAGVGNAGLSYYFHKIK